MKALVKKFLDKEISRRGFMKGMVALGFTAKSIDSVLNSVAYAETTPPSGGRSFEGTGAEVLLETLKAAGVEYIFNSNSTGQYALYDGLVKRPELKLILALQEGQAASMAQGYELASGKTAALFIPGVGIPHASNNLYNAWKDRSSIAVLTDGGHSEFLGRDMFEQVDDWLEPLQQFSKWSWHVKYPQRIGEMVRRAIKVATTPPGGPVYIRVPIDLLAKTRIRETIYPQSRFTIPMKIEPNKELIENAAKLLVEAKNPLIHVGPEVTRAKANEDLIELAELLSMPVSQGVSCYGDFPFKHPLFAGFYGMGPFTYSMGIDTFLNLGALMPDPGFITNPVADTCKVIHARIEYEDIANIYPTDVAIAAGLKETIQALTDTIKGMLTKERINALKADRLEKVNKKRVEAQKKREEEAKENWNSSPLSWERLSVEMDKVLEDDACIVSELDARTPYYWMDFDRGKKTLIGQTTGFALGWGVGASLGVKIARPDKQVVCLVGDGTLLFGQLESLWSFSRYNVPVIIVVFNNRSYDGPRNRMFNLSQHPREERKDIACYLGDPDVSFAGIAESFGIKGEMISSPDQIKPAMKRAVNATKEGRPYLIDAVITQMGAGAGGNWHPEISIAAGRKRKV
jgi:acetolactate synthase-1/2/3 large subunit